MNLIYEGVDITQHVQIKEAEFTDSAGGKADSATIVFADVDGLWSQWNPKKGEQLELVHNGFTTGLLYFDQWKLKSGSFEMSAISAPLKAKEHGNRSWENIQFLRLAKDLAESIGLTLQAYGDITDWYYDRFEQSGTPMMALNRACIREGYSLKITDGKVIIFNEKEMEQQEPVLTLYPNIISNPEFQCVNAGLYRSCTVRYLEKSGEELIYTFAPSFAPEGPDLKINTRIYSRAEAQRFSKSWLRYENKWEQVGTVAINYNPGLAAGNTVEVKEMGLANGKYYLDKVIHRFTKNQSVLFVRKVLEGY